MRSLEKPSSNFRHEDAGRPVSSLETKTLKIIDRAVSNGREQRGILPDTATQPPTSKVIEVLSSIDFSFDARNVRETRDCQEVAETIAGTLAPSIELAHRILVSPNLYQPLDEDQLIFTQPSVAYYPSTTERIICDGGGGRRPRQRQFRDYDEDNRLTAHVIGRRLDEEGLPSAIDFYAWEYAPDSNDYAPVGGLHSKFFLQTDHEDSSRDWQQVSFYSLHTQPGWRLKNPSKDLYGLNTVAAGQPIKSEFFLRVIDGEIIVASASGDSDSGDKGTLNFSSLPYWHHRPSMSLGMGVHDRKRGQQYGFEIVESAIDETWSYNHCRMNHPGFSCFRDKRGCQAPQEAA